MYLNIPQYRAKIHELKPDKIGEIINDYNLVFQYYSNSSECNKCTYLLSYYT